MAEIEADVKLGLIETVKKRFKRAEEHQGSWRTQAKEDYDFVSGEQWNDADKAILREQLRPIITFNRTGPIIEAVAGAEINNRQEAVFLPRTIDDSGGNEILTEAARWVRDLCDAEDEESDAFMDSTICGMGWTETRMDYEDDLDGEIRIDRVDPLEMYWDPDAKKRNLSDARWLMRVKDISLEDLKAMWPDKASDVVQRGPWDKDDDGGINTNANSPDQYADPDKNWEADPDKQKVRVVEYQWWERETIYRAVANGQAFEFSGVKFARLKDSFDQAGIRYLKQTKRVYRRAFVAGETILEKGLAPCESGFTFQCITGKRDRNKNTWYGLVRPMKDPQMWANKFYSQILHVINSNAKGGVIAEEDAVPDWREFERNWAKTDGVVKASPGAVRSGAITPKPTVPYPTGLDRLMEFAVDAFYSVSGVNLEMLGLADRSQPGVLEYQRRQAGLTILAVQFNSLRKYRKQQGRVLMYFIREYISDGRLIRIVGDSGAEFIPFLKDKQAAKYDVIVDEAATSPNQKERTFQIMTQILPFLMKAGVSVPPEILDYSPLPQSLVTKWKQALQGQLPPQVQEKFEELQKELQKLQQENTKLKQNQEIKRAEFEFDTQMDQAEFQRDVVESDREFGLKVFETKRELELEKEKVEGELAIKRKQNAERPAR